MNSLRTSLLVVTVALVVAMPLGAGTHGGAPGGGALDGWVDVHGDTMSANLGFTGGNGVAFPGGTLTGNPSLSYAGTPVCLQSGINCPPAAGGDITGVLAGTGLSGGGLSGTVSLALAINGGLAQTCAGTNKVSAVTSTGIVTCTADVDTNSGGTVTSVGTGSGLTGGTITGSGTISATYGGSGGDFGTLATLARSNHLHDARYFTEAESDARYLRQGNIVISHDGVYSINPFGLQPGTVQVATDRTRILYGGAGAGSMWAQINLVGPVNLGLKTYGLKQVEICASVTSGDKIDAVTVYNHRTGGVAAVFDDPTDRTATAITCFTEILPAAVTPTGSLMLVLKFAGSGAGDFLDVTSIRSTWVITGVAPASPEGVDPGDPPGVGVAQP